MNRIDNSNGLNKSLTEALRGEYGTYTMANGIRVLVQGRLVHFEGEFSGNEESVEIPRIPSRFTIIFTGDDYSCSTISEPNAGFVCVPSVARGKRFVILSTGILNI